MAKYTESEKIILNLYALVATGAILSVIPFTLLPFAGMACLTIGLIAAYIYRYKGKGDQLVRYHTTNLIRAMWWSVLVLMAGVIAFSCVLVFNGDLTPIMKLMEASEKGIVPTEDDVRIMQANFVYVNQQLIVWAAALSFLPFPLFVLFRVFKGVLAVKKGPKPR